jgi:translation initiation factor 2B subunit (eIF-2B alpha/beta/delta family)
MERLNSFRSDKIKDLEKEIIYNNIKNSNIRCVMILNAIIMSLNDENFENIKDKSKWLKNIIKPIKKFLSSSSKKALKYINSFFIDGTYQNGIIREINQFIDKNIILSQSQIIDIATKRLINSNNILTFGYNDIIKKIVCSLRSKYKLYICDDPHNISIKDIKDIKDINDIKYLYINAISYVLSDIDIVLLGCNEIMSNGDIIGPVGTALISLVAYNNNIPVIVCCDSLSFTKKIHTSIDIKNIKQIKPNYKKYILDYDITPSKFISQVVTEKGIIHPLAVHNYC